MLRIAAGAHPRRTWQSYETPTSSVELPGGQSSRVGDHPTTAAAPSRPSRPVAPFGAREPAIIEPQPEVIRAVMSEDGPYLLHGL